MVEIRSLEQFNAALKENIAVLAFFSSNMCNVCTVLKPKVCELILNSYPQIKMLHVNMEEVPNIHGQYRIFTAPTIIIFFEGSMAFMKSRSINLKELDLHIERPYKLLFDK